ncbi:hypothetical protein NE237_007898 [Protea cynaroides]|uniref:DUF569 domain-containing protein n=1 Tax=Protea cynaroides TaxID=273540 RepID=A0A9Q0KR18_9MAGN|nr:hypothetical protein NE237_007898 [Protea cynaroides]
MAGALVSNVVQQLATIIEKETEQEVQLESLRHFLKIQTVLKDAEERQIKDKSVQYWLQELKDVKLRSLEGTFLRANGGPPPWRSSITHDVPHCPATQDRVLWHVEVVDNVEADESFADFQSQISSLFSNDLMDSEPDSPLSTASNKSSKFSFSALMKSPKLSLPKSPRKSLTALESEKDNSYHESFANQVRFLSLSPSCFLFLSAFCSTHRYFDF